MFLKREKEKKKFIQFEKEYVDKISSVMENKSFSNRNETFESVYRKNKPVGLTNVDIMTHNVAFLYCEDLLGQGKEPVFVGIIMLDKNQFQYFIIFEDYRFDVLINKKFVDKNLNVDDGFDLNLRSRIAYYDKEYYYNIRYEKKYFSYHPSGSELYISFLSLTKNEFIEALNNINIISDRCKFCTVHLKDVIQNYIDQFRNKLFDFLYYQENKKWMFFSIPNIISRNDLVADTNLDILEYNFDIICFCKDTIFIV